MPRFYKGVGVGTWLYPHDIRLSGIQPEIPLMPESIHTLIAHINGNTGSPYISLTRSYGVALDYARHFGRAFPTTGLPAYVYAIDLDFPTPPSVMRVLDPVAEIAAHINSPLAPASYHHDGDMSFLTTIVNPVRAHATSASLPPRYTSHAHPSHPTPELVALTRALRDAEIIVFGSIPRASIAYRHDVQS
jgi:hypothetical protein